MPLGEWIAQNPKIYSGPPLFLILIKQISRVGETEQILRIVPWLAGTMSILAMYWLGTKYLSRVGALVAAFALAVAPAHIGYSQQLREYSLSVLMAILMLIGFTSFLEKPTWRKASILSLVMTASLFAHYGLAFLVLSLNIVMLISLVLNRLREKQILIKWSAIQGVVMIGAFIVYQIALRHQWEQGGYGSVGYLASGYWKGESFSSAISFIYSRTRDIIDLAFPTYIFTVMLYLGILVLLFLHWKSILPFLLGIPFLVVVSAALLGIYPYGGTRHNLFLTPLIYLFVAMGMDYLWSIDRKKIVFGLLLCLFARKANFVLPNYYQSFGNSGVGFIVSNLYEIALPGDPVYVCLGGDTTARYYLEVRYPMDENPVIQGVRGPGPRDYIDQVDAMLEEHQRAWMLMFNDCGDMAPLLDHVSDEWNVELIERRYPDGELYYVD